MISLGDTPRLQGSLAVSRAFGDANYHPFLSAEPEIRELQLEDDDCRLLLASDGLWNECRNEEVAQFCAGRPTADLAPTLIRRVGEERGFLEDNTTVICVDLEALRKRYKA